MLPRFTKRTALRRLGVADLSAFQAYRCDPEVARYQGWQIMSDVEAQSFLAAANVAELLRPGHWSQIGIADRWTDRLIGDVGVRVAADQGDVEIGFSMARQAQGRGLATEAVLETIQLVFEHANIGRIVGVTDARNLPSIRLMERIGMCKAKEKHTMFRGEPCVECIFVMSSDDGTKRI